MPEYMSMFGGDEVTPETEPEATDVTPAPEVKPKQQRRKRKVQPKKGNQKTPGLPDLTDLPALLACLYTPQDDERTVVDNITAKAKQDGVAVLLSPDGTNEVMGVVVPFATYTKLASRTTESDE